MIPVTFNKEIFEFIKAHESADPFELSLRLNQFSPESRKFISEQVFSRKKLKRKVPSWVNFDNIILPKPISIEQASSEITAKYKLELIRGNRILDLTGGLGVDTSFFAKRARSVDYVEKDPEISAIAQHNFSHMNLKNVRVLNQKAEEFLNSAGQSEFYDTVFLDPSRRIQSGKVFKLEDSEPDILKLLPALQSISGRLIIKASPFLDIKYSLSQLNQVSEVHVLAVENECKEILLISDSSQDKDDIRVLTVNFKKGETQKYDSSILNELNSHLDFGGNGRYLYDPNAAIRKAGLFHSIAIDFNLSKLSNNSHLYFSDILSHRFPGRIFETYDQIPYRKFLKKPGCQKANIAVRNFPLSVSEIRKKTGIKEGGDQYIFGTTDHQKNVFFILAQKIH